MVGMMMVVWCGPTQRQHEKLSCAILYYTHKLDRYIEMRVCLVDGALSATANMLTFSMKNEFCTPKLVRLCECDARHAHIIIIMLPLITFG